MLPSHEKLSLHLIFADWHGTVVLGTEWRALYSAFYYVFPSLTRTLRVIHAAFRSGLHSFVSEYTNAPGRPGLRMFFSGCLDLEKSSLVWLAEPPRISRRVLLQRRLAYELPSHKRE